MDKTQAFFREKAVLITGASSGIGEELAWQLAQAGAKVRLAARGKVRELEEGAFWKLLKIKGQIYRSGFGNKNKNKNKNKFSTTLAWSGLGGRVFRDVVGQSAYQKFLENVVGGRSANGNQRVFKR